MLSMRHWYSTTGRGESQDAEAAIQRFRKAGLYRHCDRAAPAHVKRDVTVHVYPGSRCIGMPIPSRRLAEPAGGYGERRQQSVFRAIRACIRGQSAPLSNFSYPNGEQLHLIALVITHISPAKGSRRNKHAKPGATGRIRLLKGVFSTL